MRRLVASLFAVVVLLAVLTVPLLTGGARVDGVDAAGHGPLGGVAGDCEDVAIQQLSVTVHVTRTDFDGLAYRGRYNSEDLLGADRTTVTVAVSALGETRTHEVTVRHHETVDEPFSFRRVRAGNLSATTVEVDVVVRRGDRALYENALEVRLPAVETGTSCEE